MLKRIKTLTVISALVLGLVFGLCLTVLAQVMPLPVAQQVFDYPPTTLPVLSSNPANAQPIGVGPVAEGGDTIRLRVNLAAFTGAVDLYVAFMAPALDSSHLYLLNPDGHLVVLDNELVAWKKAVTVPVDEALFPDISISALPPGQYHCYLLATPAGDTNLTVWYLWHTYFIIQKSEGGCGDYNGSKSFTLTYDHHYVVQQGGEGAYYHQDLLWSGVVPLMLQEDNTLYGTGNVTYSTEWYGTDGKHYVHCSGSTTADVVLSGRLYFNEYCEAMLEITVNEKVNPMSIFCEPVGGGVLPESSNSYELTFPVIDGATVSGPPMGPGVTGSSNYILHLVH